jgi:hypothetical protein
MKMVVFDSKMVVFCSKMGIFYRKMGVFHMKMNFSMSELRVFFFKKSVLGQKIR